MQYAKIRTAIMGVALAVVFVAGAPMINTARAQSRYDSYQYDGQYRHEGQRIAFDKGYRRGLDRGDDDYRHHRSPDPDRSSHYRNADDGYHHEYGPKEEYREAYREGFRKGYFEAYRGYRHY